AAWALFTIADPAGTDAIDTAYRKEADSEVRTALLRALGAMGDRSVPALERLVTSPDSSVRTIAIMALAGGNATGPWPWPRPRPRPFPGCSARPTRAPGDGGPSLGAPLCEPEC
ncbi:MAG: HEAT repeat domain-containing protein, partial [Gemmatimonadetes bacterium]|nr:HEAT repeat domain-containing protein [Gemmatimonadota bacterium]